MSSLGSFRATRGAAPNPLGRSYLELLAESESVAEVASAVGGFAGGSGRVLALAEVSSQDHTAQLMLIDLASGARDLVAARVVDFALSDPCDGAGCVRLGRGQSVGYLVRSREPSAHDGLWLHQLP